MRVCSIAIETYFTKAVETNVVRRFDKHTDRLVHGLSLNLRNKHSLFAGLNTASRRHLFKTRNVGFVRCFLTPCGPVSLFQLHVTVDRENCL
jgi:hypothetical protein